MQKPTLQMALGKAATLAASFREHTTKLGNLQSQGVNNPLEGNPQLPQSSTEITKTFLNH